MDNNLPVRIADLHCDLLAYLAAKEGRDLYHEEARCSLPQLIRGQVSLQTLAVYTPTHRHSVAVAEKQFVLFRTLPLLYPESLVRLSALEMPAPGSPIAVVAAIENASGLCGEGERLEHAFLRLDQYQQLAGPLLYISLTWRQENRFGGGDHSRGGLKRDGELLLEYLNGKPIAIDLSHASDQLADDILNFIEMRQLQLIPIASHSNFRSVADRPRNLPDAIAKEIIARGGVIGLNFVKFFVGASPKDFVRQIDYARSLGGLGSLCLGADFFCERDLHLFLSFFFPRCGDSSCYPELMEQWHTIFTSEELSGLASTNLARFLVRLRSLGAT